MPGRARSHPLLRAAALVGVGVSVLACGGSSSEEQRQQLAEDLVAETDGALDDSTARCVADGLHDEFGEDSFERVVHAAPDAEDDDETRVQVIDIFAECNALSPLIDDSP